jgi:hypothetical protein
MSAEFSDMENFYEALAEALDQVPEDKSNLFLCKVALSLANQVIDPKNALEAIKAGMQHMD